MDVAEACRGPKCKKPVRKPVRKPNRPVRPRPCAGAGCHPPARLDGSSVYDCVAHKLQFNYLKQAIDVSSRRETA